MPKPRISFCTVVKDRFEHLQATFVRNIEDTADYPESEFVLLDYDCPDPRTQQWARSELAPLIASGRVVYFQLANAPTFARAHARNLALRLSSGDIYCNVDADNFIGVGFAAFVAESVKERG